MPSPILIQLKQIDSVGLSGYIVSAFTGNLSGALQTYFNNSGFLGNHVLYTSGANQTVLGDKSFAGQVNVRYSGGSGSAVSKQYLLDTVASFNTSLAVQFVHTTGTETISGVKSFVSSPAVPYPTTSGQVSPKGYVDTSTGTLGGYLDNKHLLKSGDLQYTSGNLSISGNFGVTGGTNLTGDVTIFGNVNISGRTPLTQVTFNSGLFGTYLNGILTFASSGANVSGSIPLFGYRLTGVAGTNVQLSGNIILISGGGGGASTLTVSGSSTISAPNLLSAGTTVVTRSGANDILISGKNSSLVTVSGSAGITNPNFQSAGTTVVITSGDNVLISGAVGATVFSVSGSTNMSSPNILGINSIKALRSGANDILVSGIDVNVSGGSPLSSYTVTGINGCNVQTSGNYLLISGSGIQNITNNYTIVSGQSGSSVSVTGSIVMTGVHIIGAGTTRVIWSGDKDLLISGAAGGVSSQKYTYNWFLPYIITGDTVAEAAVDTAITLSGWRVTCSATGRGGQQTGTAGAIFQYPMTGNFYTRPLNSNTQTILFPFVFDSGLFVVQNGGFSSGISNSIVGIKILSGLSGIENINFSLHGNT